MESRENTREIKRPARGPSITRRAAEMVAGAALVAASLASLAHAEPVVVERQPSCGTGCMESFEVRCPQRSRFLQLELEILSGPGSAYGRFQMVALATQPALMKDQDLVRVAETQPGKVAVTTAMLRPGPEGTMRALVGVTPVLNVAPLPAYRLTAECLAGEGFGGAPIVSKPTTITPRVGP